MSAVVRARHAAPLHREGAFTLVEVLAAVAILAVSLVALIVMRNECIQDIGIVVDSCDSWVLGTLALGVIETAEVLDEGGEGGIFEDHPGYRWDVEKTRIEIDIVPEYFPGMDRASIPHKPKELLRIALTISRIDPQPGQPPELFRVVTYAPRRVPPGTP